MIRATKGVQNSSDIEDERKKCLLSRSGQTVFFPACLNVKIKTIDTITQFLTLAGNLNQTLRFHRQ